MEKKTPKNPGGIHEYNFCKRLQPLKQKPLSIPEKYFIILILDEMNKIYPNFFPKSDFQKILDFPLQFTKISHCGGIGQKADIMLSTNYKFKNDKPLEIGISYKYKKAPTIQSWTSNESWENIFRKTREKKQILKNITDFLLEISNLKAQDQSSPLFIGSTILVTPNEEDFFEKTKDKSEIDKIIKKYIPNEKTENTSYVQFIVKNLKLKNILQYQLNKYFNKILEKNPQILHYFLFGEPEGNCFLYYRDNGLDTSDFSSFSQFINHLGDQLFFCGISESLGLIQKLKNISDMSNNEIIFHFLSSSRGKNNKYILTAIDKLKNRITITPRFIYPETSRSQQRMDCLVVWDNQHSRDIMIASPRDLQIYGKYTPYYEFRKKNPTPPKILSFFNLEKYYKSSFNISFISVLNDFSLPPLYMEMIEKPDYDYHSKIDFLIITFTYEFNDRLYKVLTPEEWEKYTEEIHERFNYRKKEENKKPIFAKLLKFLTSMYKILQEREGILQSRTPFPRTLKPTKLTNKKRVLEDEIMKEGFKKFRSN